MSARKKRTRKERAPNPGGPRLPARKVVDLVPRRQEVRDLVKFIDAHGGKLRRWEAYRVRPETPGEMSAPAPESTEEPGSA